MPITSSHIQIAVRGVFLGQKVEVVQWYRLDGAAFLTATLLGVAEAYWENIKAKWRGCHIDSPDDVTNSLFLREPGVGAAYAEFVVPLAEQQGNAARSAGADWMPPFNGVGVKLSVGTGMTRPGQKRFWGLTEPDQSVGELSVAAQGEYGECAEIFSLPRFLGVPVATGVLHPAIVRYNHGTGTIVASQDVTGHILNPNVTTQNSRKFGRGA